MLKMCNHIVIYLEIVPLKNNCLRRDFKMSAIDIDMTDYCYVILFLFNFLNILLEGCNEEWEM